MKFGRKTKRYGWRPDLPDFRDRRFTLRLGLTLPPFVDLRPQCPSVYDQGDLGSCTGNAIAGAVEFERMRQELPDFTPSRLFIYYNERVIEGTVDRDAGAEIRDGIRSVSSQGACSETDWPYDVTKFADAPPQGDYTDALGDLALQYERIDNTSLGDLKTCLAGGMPFVFGFTVYESFESDAVTSSGVVPMPGADEQAIGGHAVMAVGYDDPSSRFVVRNSWGGAWGQAGYFTIPYAYLTNTDLASDFWNIKLVGSK